MHPLHGWHVVSLADDVAQMRRNGWVDDDGKALAEKLAPAKQPEALPEPTKRGPGRPKKA